MAKNIKLGNNILNGVTELKVQDAVEEYLDSFIDTTDATAISNNIAAGKTAYVNGNKITGTCVCYSITTNVINGSVGAQSATKTYPSDNYTDVVAIVYVTSDSNYRLPTELPPGSISGSADIKYLWEWIAPGGTSATIILTNVASNIEINITCVSPGSGSGSGAG